MKHYKMKSDKSGFYLYSSSILTFDNKKPIESSIMKSTLWKNNYLDMAGTGYLENGVIDYHNASTYSYEYNDAGYVTKTFRDGILQTTYILERI
jgi:hypothetical protein